MKFLLSFKHPLSEKYTEVEIEADTVLGAKRKVTNYMKNLRIQCYQNGQWEEDYFAPYTGETWERAYHFDNGGHPRRTTASLICYG